VFNVTSSGVTAMEADTTTTKRSASGLSMAPVFAASANSTNANSPLRDIQGEVHRAAALASEPRDAVQHCALIATSRAPGEHGQRRAYHQAEIDRHATAMKNSPATDP